MADELEKYRRLTSLYRGFDDCRLIELAGQSDQLTEMACGILSAEISSRQLTLTPPAEPTLDVEDESVPYGALAPRECTWNFAEREDAEAAGEWLLAQGIKCQVILPRADVLDMTTPRVAVMPADAVRMRKLLSNAVPEEYRTLVETRDQFVVPTCPRCGSTEPLLDSIKPVNQWQCENCSHIWRDTGVS